MATPDIQTDSASSPTGGLSDRAFGSRIAQRFARATEIASTCAAGTPAVGTPVPADEFRAVEALIAIDDENLEAEFLDQPILYMKAVHVWSRAQAALTQCEQEIKERQAGLARQIRLHGIPGAEKLRVTEDAIKQEFALDKGLSTLEKRKTELEYAVNILRGLVFAFQQRERSIKAVAEQRHRVPLATAEDQVVGRRMALRLAQQPTPEDREGGEDWK